MNFVVFDLSPITVCISFSYLYLYSIIKEPQRHWFLGDSWACFTSQQQMHHLQCNSAKKWILTRSQ